MQPSGRTQVVQPTIGLYFTDQPPTRARITIKIGDPYIDIPAGKRDYTISDTYELPADSDLLGLFPHAHYLAKKMRVWATEPNGTSLGLLAIDDWDFAWQEEYTFATPPLLPRGTVVHMEFTYDNSADNERNPNQPPQRVTSGERSADEMGNVTLEWSPHDPADMEKLRESKYRGLLARAPNDARAHFNLANTLSRENKIDDAIAEYRTAATLDPKLAPAQFNLGNLLQQTGKSQDAIAAFEAALTAQPAFPEAELNLGNALAATGDLAGARAHITKSLELRPGYPEATLALSRLSPSP
jgi:tetratricopeptide (TPR) repeat protein